MLALEQPPPPTDPQVHVQVSGGDVGPARPSNESSVYTPEQAGGVGAGGPPPWS